MEPKPAPPPAIPPPMQPDADDDEEPVVRDFGTVRGLRWASSLGLAVAGLGLAVVAYTFYWEVINEPEVFEPAGVNGLYVGLAVFVVGLAVGVVFIFVPDASRAGGPTPMGRDAWIARAQESRRRWAVHRVVSWIGAAVFLLGLAFVAWVYRENVAAGPEAEELSLLGTAASFSQWAVAGVLIALAGVLVWVFSSQRADLHRRTVEGFILAVGTPRSTGPQPQAPVAVVTTPVVMEGIGAPKVTQGVLSNGVREAEVRALMRRLDQMMATLPEESVATFSKSPEAGTYLKLLGDAKP